MSLPVVSINGQPLYVQTDEPAESFTDRVAEAESINHPREAYTSGVSILYLENYCTPTDSLGTNALSDATDLLPENPPSESAVRSAGIKTIKEPGEGESSQYQLKHGGDNLGASAFESELSALVPGPDGDQSVTMIHQYGTDLESVHVTESELYTIHRAALKAFCPERYEQYQRNTVRNLVGYVIQETPTGEPVSSDVREDIQEFLADHDSGRIQTLYEQIQNDLDEYGMDVSNYRRFFDDVTEPFRRPSSGPPTVTPDVS